MADRPPFIKRFSDLPVDPQRPPYPGRDELFGIVASFSRNMGLTKLGIHHETLLPGRRSSLPHAERDEDEFVLVLEGNPDVWIDGDLHALQPGDGVAFPSGTGIAHTFLNNTSEPARLLVIGEASKRSNKIVYPLNPELHAHKSSVWWDDAPARKLGPHDGKPSGK